MMGSFTGKTAIVTGASRGIGRAIAMRLAKDGAKTVLCARDVAALEAGVKEIKVAGGTATSIALDLRLPGSPAELADFAAKRFDGIDIVVNNAGATKRGAFLELTDDDWADGFALKFFGAVRLTRAAWPYLKFSRGSVVNISGGGGRTPGAEFAIGGSVNAAMQSFTKAMAEVGIADGVQVNVINPGLVRTGRFQKRLEAVAKEQGVDLATAERRMIAASKTTRVGEPEDIAALVAFIAGPEGRFLQGAMIDMDGGSTKTL
jgi:NAD(P)-dependent dehydrogenase (short-subunit alcohol dehydrogenase family)